jgi:hypothetical protein
MPMTRKIPAPWTCPKCGLTYKQAGGHATFCGTSASRKDLFWSWVDKNGPNGCWIWTGFKLNSGYGETTLNGKKITVHRLSYRWAKGDIPEGMHILHTCDTALCVNPDHLYAGKDKENTQDRLNRGRYPTKLTPDDIREIRRLLAAANYRRGINLELAAKFGVAASQISVIRSGKAWSFVK